MALRELTIAVGFQIDSHPLVQANEATDSLKTGILGAGDDALKLGANIEAAGATATASMGAAAFSASQLGASAAQAGADVSAGLAAAAAESGQLSTAVDGLQGPFARLRQAGSEALDAIKVKYAEHREEIEKIGKTLEQNRGFIAGVFTATAGTIGFAVKTAADFEAEMSRVGAISRATEDELSILTDTARELGASTAFSATEAAQGMQYLAMAGYDVQEIVAAMPGLLYTAGAAQADLGVTSDIVSNILSGFGLQAEETIRVADVLTATFTSSNTTLQSLGNTMSYVAPVAASLGVEFEEVAALAGRLGDVGIQGERAGTALRAIFTRLTAPTGGAADLLDRLGISITDSSGRMLPMVDILRQLEEKTRDMGDAQRTATLQTLVGVEAVSALTALLDVGADNIANYADVLRNSAGVAEAVYQDQQDNLHGSLKALSSAFEELQISIGNAFIPVIRAGADALRFVVNLFNMLPGPVKTVVAAGLGFVAMLSGAALAASLIIPQLSNLGSLLTLTRTGFAAATKVIPLMTANVAKLGATLNLSFWPVTLTIAGVVAGILILQDVIMALRGEGDTLTGRAIAWGKAFGTNLVDKISQFSLTWKVASAVVRTAFGLLTRVAQWGRQFGSVVVGKVTEFAQALGAVRAIFSPILGLMSRILSWGSSLRSDVVGATTQFSGALRVVGTILEVVLVPSLIYAGALAAGRFAMSIGRAAIQVAGLGFQGARAAIGLARMGAQLLITGGQQAAIFAVGVVRAAVALGAQLLEGWSPPRRRRPFPVGEPHPWVSNSLRCWALRLVKNGTGEGMGRRSMVSMPAWLERRSSIGDRLKAGWTATSEWYSATAERVRGASAAIGTGAQEARGWLRTAVESFRENPIGFVIDWSPFGLLRRGTESLLGWTRDWLAEQGIQLPEFQLPSWPALTAWAGERIDGFRAWLADQGIQLPSLRLPTWPALTAWASERLESFGDWLAERGISLPEISLPSFPDLIAWALGPVETFREWLSTVDFGSVLGGAISSAWDFIASPLERLTQGIRDFLPFSPVKEWAGGVWSSIAGVVEGILILQDVFMYLRGEGDSLTGRVIAWGKEIGPKLSAKIKQFSGALKVAGAVLGLVFGPQLIYTGALAAVQFGSSIVKAGAGLVTFASQGAKATFGIAKFGAQLLITGAKQVATFVAGIIKAGIALGGKFLVGLLGATKAAIGFNLALLTNPITWIVLGITALGAAIFGLVKHWDKVKEKTGKAWVAIKDSIGGALSNIGSRLQSGWEATKTWAASSLDRLRNVGTGFRETLGKAGEWIRTAANDFKENPLGFIIDWSPFVLLKRGTETLLGWFGEWLAEKGIKLPDFSLPTFPDLIAWAKAPIDAFIEWISGFNIGTLIGEALGSAWDFVTAPLEGLTQRIRNWFPFSPAKEGPLADLDKVGLGLVDTVASSIDSAAGTGRLEDALSGALGSAVPLPMMDEPMATAPASGRAAYMPTGGPVLNLTVNVDASNATREDAERIGEQTAASIRDVLEQWVTEAFYSVALEEV